MIEYDPSDWRSHLLDIRGSMAREILARVMACTAFSAAIVAYHKFVAPIDIPLAAHTLIGLALGLLLVFRTNAAYDRYWEGRRLWGSIINGCRNLSLSARQYLSEDRGIHEALSLWTTTFAYSTMHALRGEVSLGPLVDRLPRDEVMDTLSTCNIPLAVASRISEELAAACRRGLISEYVRVEMVRVVQQLVDHLGGCERIRRTPLPFVYVVHLRRALILYSFTLPMALVGSYGWSTIGVVLVLAYVLFGIEEIGVEIENPFGIDVNDLPLDQFCATVERDLALLLEVRHGHELSAGTSPSGRAVASIRS